MQEKILSTGIDIGTSTTQLIFSRLTIENLANSYSVPRISIVDKEVIYRSDIYFTPLKSQHEIDASKVKQIVADEYRKAGFKPEDLQTGAVIITGETARKDNANEVLSALSEMAGDFVVATAGPDLESVLSAKGAGTDKISKEYALAIANVDIGGGTSNIAVFNKGILKGTICLDIGGRLIKIDNGKIIYIYRKIKELAERNGIHINEGDRADVTVLRKICSLMADQLAQALYLTEQSGIHGTMYTNDGKLLKENPLISAVTYSGGVADCVYSENQSDFFKYGDIGVLLGEAIKNNAALNSVKRYKPEETIRATVVGAGTHTTDVSGSTISYIKEKLPIKNIPVLKISDTEEMSGESIVNAIKEKLPVYYTEQKLDIVAIGLEGRSFESFADIQNLANAIVTGAKEIIDGPIL
ncbi:ethanolamine ammonia-lyase reactivating factor EutA [Aminipila terrae]|uniref:ethanolamine ammonia-lyase reactivating factor EutA n=1 Tax=Aminipila terrae TaxID=2697030 RepID=UPI002ED2AEEA